MRDTDIVPAWCDTCGRSVDGVRHADVVIGRKVDCGRSHERKPGITVLPSTEHKAKTTIRGVGRGKGFHVSDKPKGNIATDMPFRDERTWGVA